MQPQAGRWNYLGRLGVRHWPGRLILTFGPTKKKKSSSSKTSAYNGRNNQSKHAPIGCSRATMKENGTAKERNGNSFSKTLCVFIASLFPLRRMRRKHQTEPKRTNSPTAGTRVGDTSGRVPIPIPTDSNFNKRRTSGLLLRALKKCSNM